MRVHREMIYYYGEKKQEGAVTLGNVLFFLSNIRFLLIFKLRKEFY
jgi:hypothetical protein